MSTSIAAIVYALIGITIPLCMYPRLLPAGFLIRSFAMWVLSAVLIFLLDDFLIILVLSGLLLAVLAPFDRRERVAFFFVAVPCVPAYMHAYLPFPGVNLLIILTYYKVAVAVVLLPLLFRQASVVPAPRALSVPEISLIGFVLLSGVLVTVSLGVVDGARHFVDHILLMVIAYWAISRSVTSTDDLDYVLRAILIVSLILAAIALVSTFKHWDFYRYKAPPSPFAIPDLRSGFLRIEATANTHSLGYHLAIGLIVLEHLKARLSLGLIRLWGARLALLGALYFTDSRGALLGLILAFGVYYTLTLRSATLRRAATVLGAVLVAAVAVWLIAGDPGDYDAHGTVGYRRLLLTISLEHIWQNLLFGDLYFYDHPRFIPLLQGQGIIDITNLYLQIALAFGVVGLGAYLMIFLPTLWSLWRTVARTESNAVRNASALVIAASAGWFALAATTSDVGLTVHLGLSVIALGRAICRFDAAGPQSVPARAARFRSRPALGGLGTSARAARDA